MQSTFASKRTVSQVFVCWFLLVPWGLFGQGTINFSNYGSPLSNSPRVTNGVTMQPVLAGNPGAFVVGLYWGPLGSAESSLALTAMTPRWTFDGLFDGNDDRTGYISISGAPVGLVVTLQIRIWQAGFSTYEAAVADPSFPLVGKGNLQRITTGGAGVPPTPPTSLVVPFWPGDTGLQPITLYPVPESSASVLLLVGAGLFATTRATRRHQK